MTLIDALTTVPQREKGGSTALDRFDFQTCWGIAQLLQLHGSGQDYAIAFEFHDDIIVIDSATSPTKVRFFQLKAIGKGKWTIHNLTERKVENGKKGSSIAGKMYDNRLKFGPKVEELSFVSNKPANFIDESKYPCCFSEASKENFDKFVDALKKEIACFSADEAKLFHYRLAGIDLDNYEDVLLGRMVNFIESECGLTECNSKGFYLAVVDQCRKRSKYLKDVTNFAELMATKFVSRSDMEKWLEDLEARTHGRPQWTAILPELPSLSLLQKRALKHEWDRYELDKISRPDLAKSKLTDGIRQILSDSVCNATSMEVLLEQSLPDLRMLAKSIGLPLTDEYLKAAFLYEFYAA